MTLNEMFNDTQGVLNYRNLHPSFQNVTPEAKWQALALKDKVLAATLYVMFITGMMCGVKLAADNEVGALLTTIACAPIAQEIHTALSAELQKAKQQNVARN